MSCPHEEFANEINELVNKYKDQIPPYEVGNQLIVYAVGMMLFTAPNELLAVKTILACVENGIVHYEKTSS